MYGGGGSVRVVLEGVGMRFPLPVGDESIVRFFSWPTEPPAPPGALLPKLSR